MARCQVCDGPVVNGRCKLCGMPYRNDEVLYHLNESRGEHYKHATAKARQEMRMEQIPLPDRMAAGRAAGRNPSAGMQQRNVTGSFGRAAQPNRYGRTAAGDLARNAGSRKPENKNGEKGAYSLLWILVLIFILISWLF